MGDEKSKTFKHVQARIEIGRGLVIGDDAPSIVETPSPHWPDPAPPPDDTELVHGFRRKRKVKK